MPIVLGDCTKDNFNKDPTTWGNGKCTSNKNCSYPNGECKSFKCECDNKFGKPNCSYVRRLSVTGCALNVALPFAGLAGVGNLYIGRINQGIVQLVLALTSVILGIICCCILYDKVKNECMTIEQCFPCVENHKILLNVLLGILIILIVLMYLGASAWSVVDGTAILLCEFTDNNGYGLGF